MTRLPLPAIFLRPFSILEVLAVRHLLYFDLIYEANNIENPAERMLKVIAFYLSNLKQEINSFYKKPYNPILGETHFCTVESEKYGQTVFIAEQVSHHPPISAVHIYNEKQKISMTSSYSFKVNFYTNSVTVTTNGQVEIHLGKFGEIYQSAQCLPQLLINRVIWGKRILHWANEVELVCTNTNITAKFSFTSQSNKEETNSFNGKIIHESSPEPIFTFEGDCGFTAIYRTNDKKEHVLIDIPSMLKNKIIYPPFDQIDPSSSIKIWAETNKAICADDMSKADIAKKNSRRWTKKENQRRSSYRIATFCI